MWVNKTLWKKLVEHVGILNHEMGEVQKEISNLKTDLEDLKKDMAKVLARTDIFEKLAWAIIGITVLTTIGALVDIVLTHIH